MEILKTLAIIIGVWLLRCGVWPCSFGAVDHRGRSHDNPIETRPRTPLDQRPAVQSGKRQHDRRVAMLQELHAQMSKANEKPSNQTSHIPQDPFSVLLAGKSSCARIWRAGVALSRYVDQIICNDCGTREALRVSFGRIASSHGRKSNGILKARFARRYNVRCKWHIQNG